MALGERDVIERFFRGCGAARDDVPEGIGDDAALLKVPEGAQLVAAVDTLVAGVHFLDHFPPQSTGHRALAVNLSDLAAMGAEPAWALLALTLPEVDEPWLSSFASGLDRIAREHGVALVGGDTTSGPLCISVQLLGYVSGPQALRRSGGRPGDVLFVSGTPGDSAAGLEIERGTLQVADSAASDHLRNRFLFPTPRVALGQRLREHASACIDVSDGLLGDAGKLAAASGCGVEIELEALPVSAPLVSALGDERARITALSGGEDFELCFAVPPENVSRMLRELPQAEWQYNRIGVLTAEAGARVLRSGAVMEFSHSGYDHFVR